MQGPRLDRLARLRRDCRYLGASPRTLELLGDDVAELEQLYQGLLRQLSTSLPSPGLAGAR